MWCHACFGRIRQGHYATPLLGILQGPASEFPVYKLVHPICSQIVQEYALTHEIDTTDGISDYTLLAAFRWAAEAHELPLETSPDDVRKHIWLHEFRPKIMTVGEDPA